MNLCVFQHGKLSNYLVTPSWKIQTDYNLLPAHSLLGKKAESCNLKN